jgi:hypothetical protein
MWITDPANQGYFGEIYIRFECQVLLHSFCFGLDAIQVLYIKYQIFRFELHEHREVWLGHAFDVVGAPSKASFFA